MEKQKRWQFFLILSVLLITLYNVAPTIIFYSKPLKKALTEEQGMQEARDMARRWELEKEQSLSWIKSLLRTLKVDAEEVNFDPHDQQIVKVTCKRAEDASLLRAVLPRAGAQIIFPPAQLSLFEEGELDQKDEVNSTEKTVYILRRYSADVPQEEVAAFFGFIPKFNERKSDDELTFNPAFVDLLSDRFSNLAVAVTNETLDGKIVDQALLQQDQGALRQVAESIIRTKQFFKDSPALQRRLLLALCRGQEVTAKASQLVTAFDAALKKDSATIAAITNKPEADRTAEELAALELLKRQQELYKEAIAVLNAERPLFAKADEINSSTNTKGQSRWTFSSAKAWAQQQPKPVVPTTIWTLVIGEQNPYVAEIALDFGGESMMIRLHPDVTAILNSVPSTEQQAQRREEIQKRVSLEIARLIQETGEEILGDGGVYRLALYNVQGCSSYVALDIEKLGKKQADALLAQIQKEWTRESVDFASQESVAGASGSGQFSFFNYDDFVKASNQEKKFSLVALVPSPQFAEGAGLKTTSLYVIGRGFKPFVDEKDSKAHRDIQTLAKILQARGFVAFFGSELQGSYDLDNDIIFELENFIAPTLQATRESFRVFPNSSKAFVECSTYEARILTKNKIENAIQEDLVRWKEAYQAAQVDSKPNAKLLVPKPTENVLFANFMRGVGQYFRGDDSKVLKWGLDLSGGKSVTLGLYDQNGVQVQAPDQLQKAANELYTRLNKMGVSERVIRVENDTIGVEFPGVQGVSAEELVKASAMYFHIVNEQFGPLNPALAQDVNTFLQEVWSEAVVSSKKDMQSLNEIAYRKLERARGEAKELVSPARRLLDAGLILKAPQDELSSDFNDTVSMIVPLRGDDPLDWYGMTHPLVFVFKNYALEGASLDNVHASYDPLKGNVLVFSIKTASASGKSESPRDEFYQWTSQFAEDKIPGTAREGYSQGKGWRMAVVLNGEVISAPSLNTALRDSGMITGNFSQSEVLRLATDLQAGSLSFTPKILMEQNISPDLGKAERLHGIIASMLGVIAVIAIMVAYYRFAGVVATIAVLVNLLIIWAVLQNIGAAITLPSLAGIVLTIGMAVDANVLVFERVREEFAQTKRISYALAQGYKKAFSAIVDSNLTTILAALILVQFDSGPIRGFALTIMIGIASSMFTSLFMTKYYFAGWVQNPANKELAMARWIPETNFDFLRRGRAFLLGSLIVLVAGAGIGVSSWRNILGMDFTGGYALTVEVDDGALTKQKVVDALKASGLDAREFHVRELGNNALLRIQLSLMLDQPGRPFAGMPEQSEGNYSYEFQRNPRVNWVVQALEQQGVLVKRSQKQDLLQYWTKMSGQFSQTMRNQAMIALFLSLLGVLIYIAVRFEWIYAVSSVASVVYNLLMTLSILAVVYFFGGPIQINIEVIGALMTIIGYSLNDTIIVFDRVREDVQLFRKKHFSEIVNYAINKTLSRTVLTTITTLAVLICLVLFGGGSIFVFSFTMLVGVFIGTLSTMFVASPLLARLHEKDGE